MTRLLVLCCAAAVLGLAASCTYVEATSTQYVGVPTFARADPDKVRVLAAEPRERHDRLGEVTVRASIEPPASKAEIEERLREEAAKWGANAVYIVRDVGGPNPSARNMGDFHRDRIVIGIAVRIRQ